MRLIFLGTGTSQGIPVIGCSCPVCQSDDFRDKRLRSSVLFIKEGFHLLIDMTPDLRQQLLSQQIDNIDAICITHEHNDHVSGVDEIRPINFKWKKSIPIYTLPRVIQELKTRFYYAFEETYAARPRLTVHPIHPENKLNLGPFEIRMVRVHHGSLEILGFIVDNIAYLTDVKSLDAETLKRVAECDVVVLSALHKRPHYSHLNLDEAIDLARKIGAPQTYLTHIAHGMGFHKAESANLPNGVHFAHDGMVVSMDNQ